MTEKAKKSLKPVGSRSGVMYGSRKVHETRVENCPPFQPILLAFGTSTNKTCEILSANFKTFDI